MGQNRREHTDERRRLAGLGARVETPEIYEVQYSPTALYEDCTESQESSLSSKK